VETLNHKYQHKKYKNAVYQTLYLIINFVPTGGRGEEEDFSCS
jgi:hypothetical protein